MLTRLKVSGFKNLVDVDVLFGRFTCVAGANGTGKSNLFDAIQFLSRLADDTLLNAALAVRAEGGRTADLRHLFRRSGDRFDDRMTFEVEMIVPSAGIDDLGQRAEASITFLRYQLTLGYRADGQLPNLGGLEILHEELSHINVGDAAKNLRFPHKAAWRRSVVKGRRVGEFISTGEKEGKRIVKLHQDGTAGRPREYLAATLPRTVLSSANAIESPTTLLARRELQSWRLLQLEPSALRKPDEFTAPPRLGVDGAHMPSTLNYLARTPQNGAPAGGTPSPVLDELAARLSELVEQVQNVRVDRDDQRQILTLELTDLSGTPLPARSLSDGTLRFLALVVLSLDPREEGLICLEEPENGIHPERIPVILQLLQEIAVDVESEVGTDNPLRQVIINTHSPGVVSQVADDSILVSELQEVIVDGKRGRAARFRWLPDTWRCEADPATPPVARGKLLAYLNPVGSLVSLGNQIAADPGSRRPRRLVDRPDFQPYLLVFQQPK
jgi:predicted ATPase